MKNLNRHWYVVGHRAGVRIFEQRGIQPELHLVQHFENPDGLLKESELVSDRQGRSDQSGRNGHTPVGADDVQHKRVVEVFAREVGTYLEHKAHEKAFVSLVLVAEPQVLGILKSALGKATLAHLKDSVDKDLVKVANYQMSAALAEHLCTREEVHSAEERSSV